MAGSVPQEAEVWIVQKEGCAPASAAAARRRIEEELCRCVRAHLSGVSHKPSAIKDAAFDLYASRVWRAIEYHWKRLGDSKPLTFQQLLARAEAADLGVGTGKASLVYEVVLSQALEFREDKAAEMFDANYMPGVRANARRVADQRGIEMVENFTADLIMPRGDRPPKIAQYQGKTFLSQWLRSVVNNHCLSILRKHEPESLTDDPMPSSHSTGTSTTLEVVADRSGCQKLLAPLFKAALEGLTPEQCLLIKLITLDGVPQGQVAKAMGIHSGNVGRQRDKAVEGIFKRLWETARARSQEAQFSDCFYSALSGEDPILRDWVGQQLAGAFSDSHVQQGQGDDR